MRPGVQKEKKKRILVSPLNWGLGHATRCIPLIRHLLKSGHEVIIASDNEALALLKQAFPHLESTSLPAYDIHYPPGGNMLRHFITRSPKILSRIHDEHRALQEIIASQRIDAVISDNRFGLWSRRVPTAFITHQLFIRSPLLQGMIRKINQRYIHKFDHCWIPDLASGDTLSGELSRGGKCPKNVRYIGPLSRFNPGLRESDRDTESYEVAA
ncbi:MAG: glycosyltransferase, partial [Flavobacteriales bacterium]